MISSVKKRTGRPLAEYKDRHGIKHQGLMKLADGRWRISGPEKTTFTEASEDLAIARFLKYKADKAGITSGLGTLKIHASAEAAIIDMMKRTVEAGGSLTTTTETLGQGSGVYAVADETLSPAQWAWVGKQIIARPKWVAIQCGVEQVGYLNEAKLPARIPSLDELAETWKLHFDSSPEQKRKCPKAFKTFCKIAGINAIKDITPEAVVAYRDSVYRRNLSGKTQSNIFTRVRRYLAFFRDRAIAIDEMTKAIGYLGLLTPDETTVSIDPKPIEVADWKKLLSAATGDDRAMILLMLNCAMYLQEVINVKWAEIKNGCLVTHRAKTGKCVRVAVLWPETLKALAEVRRHGANVLNNYTGAPLGIKGAELRFRELRDIAEVDVTASQLRDGAYTAAVEANVTSSLCKLLVGHSSGLADHYVKRKPSMVAPACEAIRAAYF